MGNRLIAWTEMETGFSSRETLKEERLRMRGAEDIELYTLQDKRRGYMAWNGGS